MTEHERGSDRLGWRAKRFLSPSQEYELWLPLLRGQTTIGEAADQVGVDRSTIMRLPHGRQGRRDRRAGRVLAGCAAARRDVELGAARAGRPGWAGRCKELAVKLLLVEGKGRWAAWPGPVPGGCGHQGRAVGSARAGRGAGWAVRGACRVLEVSQLRIYRWLGRRAAGELVDQAPGGSPMHGLLDWEVAEMVRLFQEGARLTAPTASSPTAAPTPSGCGVARQRAPRAGA